MIDLFSDISAGCELTIPIAHHKVVGVIGAGGIVTGAHLPAYRKAGLPVHAITDIDSEKAQSAAEEFNITRVYSSAKELLADPDIEVVDIAVPAAEQPALLLAALEAGKHVLAQKPLSTTVEDALDMAAKAQETGLHVGVNQQLRFDEGIAAAHRMVDLGWIGKVSGFSITVNLDTPWHLWDWALSMPRLEVLVHSIHYHDVVRWFFGEPSKVLRWRVAQTVRLPSGKPERRVHISMTAVLWLWFTLITSITVATTRQSFALMDPRAPFEEPWVFCMTIQMGGATPWK